MAGHEYIDTAFAQLAFAIKLMQAAEEERIKVEDIDTALTINDERGRPALVLPDRVLNNQNELINACQNLVGVCFGVAAMTLDRAREELDVNLPDPIDSDVDQWIALIYQVSVLLSAEHGCRCDVHEAPIRNDAERLAVFSHVDCALEGTTQWTRQGGSLCSIERRDVRVGSSIL